MAADASVRCKRYESVISETEKVIADLREAVRRVEEKQLDLLKAPSDSETPPASGKRAPR